MNVLHSKPGKCYITVDELGMINNMFIPFTTLGALISVGDRVEIISTGEHMREQFKAG